MRFAAGLACLALAAGAVADTITYGGETYEDVLVYESDSFYYVVLPNLGEVQNVPKDGAATVSIVRDRAYRDQLMTEYEEARQAQAPGAAQSAMARAQAAAESMDPPPGTAGEAGPGAMPGGASAPSGDSVVISAPEEEGLGISLNDLQSAVQGMGITLAPGTMSGSAPPLTISATGSRSNLQSVTVQVEAPTAEAMTTLPNQVSNLETVFSGFAPWVIGWMNSQQGIIMSGGQASETQDGIQADLQASGLSGQQVSVTLTTTYVGQ